MALSPAAPAAKTAARIGIFGGAFDPPHNAHEALAQAALGQLRLDELRIFPTGQAWHKAHGLSAAEHRLAMARLAFEGLPGALVDDREIRRSGPTYTLDTLREMRLQRPDAELLLLLGADQARALPKWHGWHEILTLAIVCVAQRPDPAGHSRVFDPDGLPGRPVGARFQTVALPPMELSATDIRARAARGEDISRLVPPAVARYIELHHLYANT